MNFFYLDQTGRKQGPVSEQQLQALATQGIITPTTPMKTDTGYKGVAGQIPGLKFDAAVPPMNDVYVAPVAESSDPKQARYLSKPAMAAAAVTILLLLTAVVVSKVGLPFGKTSHPLKKAETGDWVRYDGTMSMEDDGLMKATHLIEVVSKDDKVVKLRKTFIIPEQRMSSGRAVVKEIRKIKGEEFDFSKPFSQELTSFMLWTGAPGDITSIPEVKTAKSKKTRETVSILGQKFVCDVITETIPGGALTGVIKVWTSDTAPITGLVKSEVDMTMAEKEKTLKGIATMTLAAFGNDPLVTQKVPSETMDVDPPAQVAPKPPASGMEACMNCNGTGKTERGVRCPRCSGRGQIRTDDPCLTCSGTGRMKNTDHTPCFSCKGTGKRNH